MAELTLAVWNMEWMNDLFGPNQDAPAFRPDDEPTAHSSDATVKQRREHLSSLLQELKADLIVIVEGPNRTGELQLFFDEDMPGSWQTYVQPGKGLVQNVCLAVRVDEGRFADIPMKTFDTNNLEVFDPFQVDVDEDGISEQYQFSRRPLYTEIYPKDGNPFRILGLHLKSKGIFSSYEWSKWWQIADANRRKILAQATRIRLDFLDPYFEDPETANIPLIVCGDINDGPGLDASEKRLFGSGIERLMGTVWKPDVCFGNALFDQLSKNDQRKLDFSDIYTTNFKDPIFNSTWHRVWIDHVLYSKNGLGSWVHDARVHRMSQSGEPVWRTYPHASDHFPIVATVST
ncbi:MAG: hypothetical protein RIG62_12355 [Cyclobacteriaceae bacterium]